MTGRPWTCPTCGANYNLAPAGASPQASQGETITQPQVNKLFALFKENAYNEEWARKIMRDKWNIESTRQLTKKQASELIAQLIKGD